MSIAKEDIKDLDIVDAIELASDGYYIFLTSTVISTTNSTKTILINLPLDIEGIQTGRDHLVNPTDRVYLTGTSEGLADGYYIVNEILSDTSFSVNENIANSTGGNIYFMFSSGASKVGFDSTGLSNITSTNIQGAIRELSLNGYLRLTDVPTKPSTPTSGIILFSKFRAGRRTTSQISQSGLFYSFQPTLYTNRVSYFSAIGTSSIGNTINFSSITTGTATGRSLTTTNLFTTISRIGYVSANPKGSSAGLHQNVAIFYSGNSIGLGGFFFSTRFGISQTQINYRWLVAMSATTSVYSNVEPSTIINSVGVGMDSTDTEIQFMHNNASGNATKVSLGTNFPRPTANIEFYEFRLFIAPNSSTYYWSLENLEPTNNIYTEGNTGNSIDIPSNTTFLCPHIWINNNTVASAVAIDIENVYVETNY